MVAIKKQNCCLAVVAGFFELCFVGSFVLGVVGLAYQQFYYQKGSGLSGRITTRVNYDFQLFTYSYKLHVDGKTYFNYTNTMAYTDAYEIFCEDNINPPPDYCNNLKHISGNHYTGFLLWCANGGVLLTWVIGVLGLLWGCCCNCKCGNTKICECAKKCQKQFDITFHFIEFILCVGGVLGYALFLFSFNINFNKAKPGLDELMLQVMAIDNVNIEWNNFEIGKSNYLVGSGFICSIILLIIAFISLIRLCFGCGGGISDLTGNSNNNDNKKEGMLTRGDEGGTTTTPYTIVVNNN